MTEHEIVNIIETTLEEKIEQNPNFIRYTFYEIIVKHNLSKKDEILFSSLIRNKLHNLGYIVYFRGASYEYEGKQMIIEDNELLIAIRKREERIESNGRKTKKTKHK